MALERTALRIAAVEALAPADQYGAAQPVWPTLAGGHVYDSHMQPVDDLTADEKRPIVVVTTERDETAAPQRHGGRPAERTVELRVEMSVVAALEVEGQTYVVALPGNDPEVEAQLDLLEEQVDFALRIGPSGALYRAIGGGRIISTTSDPDRAGEEAVRLSMRSLVLTVRLTAACFDAAPPTVASGFDRLPEPLRTVALALPATSYALIDADGGPGFLHRLADAAATAPVLPSLDVVRLDMEVASADGTQDGDLDMEMEIPIDQDQD